MKSALCILLMTVGLAFLAGCQDKLFPENEPRSQFERYQMLRGQSAPMVEEDAFGQERPALRQRLRPMD